MSEGFRQFKPSELVIHPYDPETFGFVISQDNGSVLVEWWLDRFGDLRDTDTVGSINLDRANPGSDVD